MRGLHSVAVSVIPLLRVRTETPSLAELLQIQECDIFAIKANVSLKGERNHGYLIKKTVWDSLLQLTFSKVVPICVYR